MKIKNIFLKAASGILCLALVFFSCSKSGDKPSNPAPPAGTPDATLTNLGTNIIVPAYQQLATTTAALDAAVTAFNAGPTSGTLTGCANCV